jgi:hypothetical protein
MKGFEGIFAMQLKMQHKQAGASEPYEVCMAMGQG